MLTWLNCGIAMIVACEGQNVRQRSQDECVCTELNFKKKRGSLPRDWVDGDHPVKTCLMNYVRVVIGAGKKKCTHSRQSSRRYQNNLFCNEMGQRSGECSRNPSTL